jgi:hypothetical protein
VTESRTTTGQPPSVSAFMYSPECLEFYYSDLPLSIGALCTRVAATRRSTRITTFMMTTVCTASVGGRKEVAKYICGNLCEVRSGVKEALSLVYPELDDVMRNMKEGVFPRNVLNLIQ